MKVAPVSNGELAEVVDVAWIPGTTRRFLVERVDAECVKVFAMMQSGRRYWLATLTPTRSARILGSVVKVGTVKSGSFTALRFRRMLEVGDLARPAFEPRLVTEQDETLPAGIGHYPRVTALALTFPTLNRADGVVPFDAKAFARWARGPTRSDAARHAARFVLRTYNTSFPCKPFDVVAAMVVWDRQHREAFLAWARDPWWA